MKNTYFFWSFFVLVFFEVNAQQWEEISNKDNIVLERLNTENSEIFSLRATSRINTNIENLILNIENVENYPKWLYRYKLARIIKKSERGFTFRAVIKAPIPFKDRKVQIEVTRVKMDKTVEYILKNMPVTDSNFCPSCKTVNVMEGSWKVTKIDRFLTEIQNTMQMEVSLPLPKGLVYSLMYNGPINSFEKLRGFYK